MTDQTKQDAKTIDVPTAGRDYLGLSRASSYAAAKAGTIPTIRVGRKLRVPVAAMKRLVGEAA